MKVLFVAVFTPNSTNVAQGRGFKDNGCDVLEYDYRSKLSQYGSIAARDANLISVAMEFKPDIMVFSKCNQMHYRVVDECNKFTTTAMWYMDALHNFDRELMEKTKRCNYFISGVEGVTPEAKKYNKNTFFVNQCPDEKMNFMISEDINYIDDATFIGSVDSSKIHGDRSKYVNLLKTNFEGFKHYNGVYGLEHNKVVNHSKINLNFSPTDATGASVRVYKILAAGGFLLTTPWQGLEETFTPNENIVTFKTEAELLEKVKYYLNNEEERTRIRLNGYEKVQQYLPKQWAKNVLDLCLKEEK